MTEVKRVFTVDGKPFFPIGAQSQTSSAYNDSESEQSFKAIKLLHGNTLITDVYWEQLEPQEGKFDFTAVDALLASARRYGVKLILLWFATWKNANMDYAPEWVKANPKRYKRAMAADGSDLWVLSSYCKANLEADKKAFAALCKHLKAKDSVEHTVICLQVENEPAISGTDRDYRPEAQEVWNSPVPAKLMASMKAAGKGEPYDCWQRAGGKKSGIWPEIFGLAARDMVSAWSIATYIDSVAEAGKTVYNLPMYINAAVGAFGAWRGPVPDEIFCSGEPVPKVLDIYKWFTPHIDLIAPDIYTPNSTSYEAECAVYARDDNPLFLPESGHGGCHIWNSFRAIANYNLTGYFFFGSESIVAEDGSVRPEAKNLVDTFRCAAAVIPLLLKYQGTGKVHAVVQEDYTVQQWLAFDGYLGRIQFGAGRMGGGASKDWRHSGGQFTPREQAPDTNRGRGLVFQTGKNEFYLVGANYRLFLRPKYSPDKKQPLVFHDNNVPGRQFSIDEGHFDQQGKFVVDRRRNGDNISNGLWVEPDIGVLRVRTCD
jgi:hypothetical protein